MKAKRRALSNQGEDHCLYLLTHLGCLGDGGKDGGGGGGGGTRLFLFLLLLLFLGEKEEEEEEEASPQSVG